ncbi:methyltransferase [Microbulbifer sp. SA54]|uniref:methyltransferase n=1 Tax=Microbulbifer sp. SA54 TaxID=3401577 RepID=UPI003AAAA714
MLSLLARLVSQASEATLWIADENSKPLLQPGLSYRGTLLSNRWDIVQQARRCGIEAYFNDFDLAAIQKPYQQIIYPVSKEKAAVHHVINAAARSLPSGGELILLGEKNSGIKTYAQKAAQRCKVAKSIQKHGNDYLSISTMCPDSSLGTPLDDSDYSALQQPDALGGLYSKPGQFGWNKVDAGSALLTEHFAAFLPAPGAQIVDLGCGYGYLSARIAKLGDFSLTATDNNAAALRACAENFAQLDIKGNVLPGDAGSEVPTGSADLVICNPPFHQGFQVEGDLTDRFLQQAARILRPRGTALFVVNEFIPVGRKAQGIFTQTNCVDKAKGFCVYQLTK